MGNSKSAKSSKSSGRIIGLIKTKIIGYKKSWQSFKQRTQETDSKTLTHELFTDHIETPFKRYLSLVEKELRVLINDKAAMAISFLIPIIVILLLTVGSSQTLFNSESGGANTNALGDLSKTEIPNLGIINFDTSEGFDNRDLSNELMEKFETAEQSGQCVLFKGNNQTEFEMMIGRGELTAFIVIPNLFEYNLSIHLPVILPFVLDTTDTLRLTTAQTVVDSVITEFRTENGFMGVFETTKINVNLPEKSQTFFASAPYLVPIILFAIGSLTSTQAIVADIPKDRMVLTPTNKREMMAAKVTANQIIMMALSLLLIISSAIVDLQIRSSWFSYFVVTFILSLNAVLIGVAISAVSKAPLTAFQYFIFLLIFQTIAIFFIEDPNILRWMPIHNGYDLMLKVVLRGQSFWSARNQIIDTLLESIVIYEFAYLVFKRQKTML